MDRPIFALFKAIHTSTHRAAKKLMGFGGIELDKKGNLKEEDAPRYESLYSELLYFYMHMTLRLAHEQRFREPEITKLQHQVFPPIIEGMVEGLRAPARKRSDSTDLKVDSIGYYAVVGGGTCYLRLALR